MTKLQWKKISEIEWRASGSFSWYEVCTFGDGAFVVRLHPSKGKMQTFPAYVSVDAAKAEAQKHFEEVRS